MGALRSLLRHIQPEALARALGEIAKLPDTESTLRKQKPPRPAYTYRGNRRRAYKELKKLAEKSNAMQ